MRQGVLAGISEGLGLYHLAVVWRVGAQATSMVQHEGAIRAANGWRVTSVGPAAHRDTKVRVSAACHDEAS